MRERSFAIQITYFLLHCCFFFFLFSLPTLVQSLNLFEVPVTIEQLKEPTEALVTGIYEYFLALMTGFNRDDIRGIPYNTLTEVNHPELYGEFNKIVFLRNLFYFMNTLGVTGFNMRDIVSPDAGRTRRALSAIMNYAKFSGDIVTLFENSTTLLQSHDGIRTSINFDITSQEEELSRILRDRSEFEPEINKLRIEVASAKETFETMEEKQNHYRQLIRSHKVEVQALKEAGDAERALLDEIEADLHALRQNIVGSPGKMRKTIYDLDIGVSRARKETVQLQADVRALTLRVYGLNSAETELRELDEEMKICEIEFKKLASQLAALRHAHEPLEQIREKIAALERLEAETLTDIERSHEKMYKMEKDFEKRKLDMKISMQDVSIVFTG